MNRAQGPQPMVQAASPDRRKAKQVDGEHMAGAAESLDNYGDDGMGCLHGKGGDDHFRLDKIFALFCIFQCRHDDFLERIIFPHEAN